MDRRMDEWVGGWMVRRIDGQTGSIFIARALLLESSCCPCFLHRDNQQREWEGSSSNIQGLLDRSEKGREWRQGLRKFLPLALQRTESESLLSPTVLGSLIYSLPQASSLPTLAHSTCRTDEKPGSQGCCKKQKQHLSIRHCTQREPFLKWNPCYYLEAILLICRWLHC